MLKHCVFIIKDINSQKNMNKGTDEIKRQDENNKEHITPRVKAKQGSIEELEQPETLYE